MNGNDVLKKKPSLLHCTSLYFHQKTSYLKLYTKHMEKNFNYTYFDIITYFKSHGRKETENYVKNIIYRFDIICITTDKPYFSFNFFQKLKKINKKLIIVYTDGDALTNFPSYSINFINEIDLYAINDSLAVINFLKKNKKNAMLWTAVYNNDFYKIENTKKTNDVIFYGGVDEIRDDYINDIKQNEIKIGLFGKGFNNYFTPIEKLNIEINKSKIGLGINSISKKEIPETKYFKEFEFVTKHIKGKNLEIPLSGTFLLTEYFDDLNEIYTNNKDAVFFETKKEMTQLIKYYLKNEEIREEIALSGHLRAIKNIEGNVMANKLINEIYKIYENIDKNHKEKTIIKHKAEKNIFVTWSLNYAFIFFSQKNFKAFFDMLKVIKYGIPINYILTRIKHLIINILIILKNTFFKKKT